MELFQRETARPASILIPKSVSDSQVVELPGQNAPECGPHHRARQGGLGDARRPEVHVLGRRVVRAESVDRVVVQQDAGHVMPGPEGRQAAPLAPPVVGRHAVLPAPLQVERGQVEAEVLAGLLEQVVRHFSAQGLVVGLRHLVAQPHHQGVDPAGLVEIVGLLQHLVEGVRGHNPVPAAPSFHGGRQQGVAEAEGGLGEDGRRTRVHIGVVAAEVAGLLQHESVPLHVFSAENHGQEFVVRDVLHEGDVDPPGLLEQSLVRPVGIHLGQFPRQRVVRTDHEGVDGAEGRVLVHPGLAGKEAVDVLSRTDAALIGLLQLQWQEGLQSERVKHWKHFELAALEGPQLLLGVLGIGVDGVPVQKGGEHIEGGPRPEGAILAKAVGRTDKVQTPLAVVSVKCVIRRNVDGQAIGMWIPVAAFWCLASP